MAFINRAILLAAFFGVQFHNFPIFNAFFAISVDSDGRVGELRRCITLLNVAHESL